jgi:hypothetical protein
MDGFLRVLVRWVHSKQLPNPVTHGYLALGGELTGMIPLVRSVGYVYASLFCVLARMFCSVDEMSMPSAVADVGKGAAATLIARKTTEAVQAMSEEEIMMADRGEMKQARRQRQRVAKQKISEARLLMRPCRMYFYNVGCPCNLLASRDKLARA